MPEYQVEIVRKITQRASIKIVADTALEAMAAGLKAQRLGQVDFDDSHCDEVYASEAVLVRP